MKTLQADMLGFDFQSVDFSHSTATVIIRTNGCGTNLTPDT